LQLDFTRCPNIDTAGLNELAENLILLSNLTSLTVNFEGCTWISDEIANKFSQSVVKQNKITNVELNFSGTRVTVENQVELNSLIKSAKKSIIKE